MIGADDCFTLHGTARIRMKRLYKNIQSISKTTLIKETFCCFDGNDDINSTKEEEHCRRGNGGSSSLVKIKNPLAKPTCGKKSFLKNRHHKMQLINLPKPTFVKAGINVRQSHGYTDAMIYKTGLQCQQKVNQFKFLERILVC